MIALVKARKRFALADVFGPTLPFLAVVCIQAALATLSFNALSNARAYVAGESLWTKGQKDAIHHLSLYAVSRDEADYARYRASLAVPLGDRAARRALERSPPDRETARQGLLAGGNDPADIPGMIRMFVYGRNLPFLADAVAKWRATDPLLDDLESLGPVVRDGAALARIEALDARMTPLARAFSDALGDGSRLLAGRLAAVNVAAGAALFGLSLWRARVHARQRRQADRALAAERERAARTLEEIGEAVLRIDASGRIRYANAAAQALAGLDASALGRPLDEALTLADAASGAPVAGLAATILRACEPRARRSGLVLLTGRARIPVTLAHARLADERGGEGAALVLHDRSQEQDLIERLAELASRDPLTGLANRREFERALTEALAKGLCAVALIDLDRFKQVNDSGGHAAGDALLRHTAALIGAHLRPGDLAARLGGDEFAVLLPDCDRGRARETAEAIRAALCETAFVWEGRRHETSASLGVASIPKGPHDREAALRAADAACYRAKAAGRNRVELTRLDHPPRLAASA